jgi:hypothetical protein
MPVRTAQRQPTDLSRLPWSGVSSTAGTATGAEALMVNGFGGAGRSRRDSSALRG